MSQKWSMPIYGVGPPITDEELSLFSGYLAELCGITFDAQKKYLLEARLAPLLSESGSQSYAEFYAKAKAAPSRWRERLIECMMTNETLWFRDPPLWELLRDEFVPRLAERARRENRRVRIWSAGCSTGQEPYSLAMVIDSLAKCGRLSGLGLRDFDIIGTDISRAAIILARAGRYDPVSMRRGLVGDWEAFRDRYFETQGSTHTLSDGIKEHVRLEKASLQDDFGNLGRFDLVLLRYVAIYFSQEFRHSLLARIARTLEPRGLLVLGSTEMLSDTVETLTVERHGNIHAYRMVGT